MSQSLEIASQSETLALYNSLAPWLEEHGSLTVNEERIVTSLHLGAWVVQGIVPSYDFSVRADSIVKQAQGLDQVFCVGGEGVILGYYPGHYLYDEQEALEGIDPDFANPVIQLSIPTKKVSCPVSTETLTLTHHTTTNEIYVWRSLVAYDPNSDSEITSQQFPALQGQPGSLRRDELEALGQLHDLVVMAPDLGSIQFTPQWQDQLLSRHD